MQDKEPNLPGYYQKRKLSLSKQVVLETEEGLEDDDVEALYDDEEEEQGFVDGEFDESSGEESGHGHGDVLDDWDSDEWEAKLWVEKRIIWIWMVLNLQVLGMVTLPRRRWRG
ncbi:hypothetical protein Patl1_13972 [Pistacia atlantica]|uniref:Uncharacterized protein n=1 Tax=Pistacia atlantica TaxID=434234 RepID=A0ACC1ASA6_9ROSI|nr:hypothetical protein Patl1_13972 [Pistacia atlantica]